jgi:tol-pal system protein YbgF
MFLARLTFHRTLLVSAMLACLWLPSGASAQLFGSPAPPPVDVSSLLLRLDRLEKEVRSLTGQLEQTQFELRRLQEQSGRAPIEDARPPGRRSDMLDPSQAPPARNPLDGRPGVAGPLGGAPAVDQMDDPNAPLDLLNPRRPRGSGQGQNGPAQGGPSLGLGLAPGPAQLGATPPSAPLQAPISAGESTAATPVISGPRGEYEAAIALVRANQLDDAEASLKGFLERYPNGQLSPGAAYNLGDIYARRGRHREAAEQFLKISTDFSKSAQAPQSLLRLGQSLEKLGAKEQACAAWGEIGRKYPNAGATIKTGADRDMKRVQC